MVNFNYLAMVLENPSQEAIKKYHTCCLTDWWREDSIGLVKVPSLLRVIPFLDLARFLTS